MTRLPGFAEGDVSVQDAAAQLAAPLLLGGGLPRGAHVLDACAAPGGKTAHLLELADLDLLAIDRDPARLVRVDQTLARLGLRARTRAADAADPCSLVGRPPLRRHPPRRPVQRLGHRAPPPRYPLAAAAGGHRRFGAHPGGTCSMPSGRLLRYPVAACSTAPARSSVPRARRRSTLFCNGNRGQPSLRPRHRPASSCRYPTIKVRRAAADGFFLTLLEKHTQP